jgi:AmiR/NasT family two-component response regulator
MTRNTHSRNNRNNRTTLSLRHAVKKDSTCSLIIWNPEVEDLTDLRMSQRQFQAVLDGDRDINVAIGIAMVRQQLGRGDAVEQLRKAAWARRLKLTTLASE